MIDQPEDFPSDAAAYDTAMRGAEHDGLSADGPWAVKAENVTKAYQRGGAVTPVLHGVDLSIRSGECVFLAGPSGSGKTTLLSILGCILTPDTGRVQILGHDIRVMEERERTLLRRRQIGFVFQRFQLIRGLSAIENVCVPLSLASADPKVARERANRLLQAVGLADRTGSLPSRLSAGQCQRVALARALASDPELILADEPTASLDEANGQEIMRVLRRLTTEEGKAAIVVTHDPRIYHFADRILHLNDGQIVRSETPSAPALI